MNQKLKPNPESIANYIHLSKYAQYVPKLKRRETFKETVDRVRKMHIEKFPNLVDKIYEAFNFIYAKKILPSMRSMQFAGEPIKERNERMYNCSFTLIDRSEVFGQILYLLLCGVGVGFSVQKQHVAKLPKLKKIDFNLVCHHTIKDTIEGWANAVTALVNGFINGYYVEFNYCQIRPVGSQLKSGGKAPGHLDLKEALEFTNSILKNAQGRQLKPIECHDIICHLSKAVLAGGIRRSSLISLFSYDDNEMMFCKTTRKFEFNGVNSQRVLCNNSAVLDPNTCTYEQFENIIDLNKNGYGDPGFIFIEDSDCGINPCGEIGINPVWENSWENEILTTMNLHDPQLHSNKQTGFGFCNLVEINAVGCENEQNFWDACKAASFIATLQASYTNFPYLGGVSENIVKRDALIGVSITGMMDAGFDIFDENVLQIGADCVKEINIETAKEIGINPAVRCTCIKPAGTSSLELGCVSTGIHPHPAKYYFKRITANPLEPVFQYFKKHNPLMCEEKPNGDWCITFPVQTDGVVQNDLTAIEFLNKIFLVYENWILPTHKVDPTHNVSCTIIVKENEWDDVLKCIWEGRSRIRCLTFLPEKVYEKIPFMPNEPTRPGSRWEQLIKTYQSVDYTKMEENEDMTIRGSACNGDKCGIEDRTFIQGDGYRVFMGDIKDIYKIKGIENYQINRVKFSTDGLWFEYVEQRDGYFIAKRVVK